MFDIATAKTKLGIVGTLQDVQLQAAIDTALAIAEKYCDRKFMYAAETASFYMVKAQSLKLYRYPVEKITSITDPSGGTTFGTDTYKANLNDGVLVFDGWHSAREIDVSYAGGYKTLPADLELALWDIFNSVWSATPGWGATVGAVAPASGAIKSITLPDVGKIDYDISGGAAAGSGAGSGAGGYITPVAVLLLDKYKAESAVGCG